ncbi:MAG: glycine cleavage system protein GcvH [Dehalococcoidia bacterium]
MAATMRFTETHEWVRVEAGSEVATVGITQFAQEQLGDVVFVELPEPGTVLTKGDVLGVVESVKVAADLVTPVSGEILSRNDALGDAPELVNSAPQGEGWMITIRMSDPGELEGLLDEAGYEAIAHEE